MMVSPCKTCTRVKYPKECGNKQCEDWLAWFLLQWEEFNNYARKYLKKDGRKDDGNKNC